MFEDLYHVKDGESELWGDAWCGPKVFSREDKALIATLKADPNSDGRNVDVYVIASPARFYELHVGETVRHFDNKKKPAYIIKTGSSEAKLAKLMADKIADGSLDVSPA